MNGYHQEWLGFMAMNRDSVAAFDSATCSVAISFLLAQPMQVVELLIFMKPAYIFQTEFLEVDRKQSRDSLDQPSVSSLTTFAFRLSEV